MNVQELVIYDNINVNKSKRPSPIQHSALPNWDQSDNDGIVHTTPPPELVIPSKYDVMFMRGDFNGINLDVNRWGTPPYFIGANTTPVTMLMSPMLIMYSRKWQDAWFTESAERNYSHVVIASAGWNFVANGFNLSISDIVNWANYVKSWGNYVVYWGNCQSNDPYLIALVDAHAIDFNVIGEEVNSKVDPTTLEQIIDNNLNIFSGPTGVHFTSNYPISFPLDTYMPNWGKYNGKVHLCWQANQNDSAGKQGAMLYYARQRVNLGWQGEGNINPSFAALDSLIFLFETMASAQFNPNEWNPKVPAGESSYGTCTEEYGCLRSLENLYCPNSGISQIRPVAGSCNGLRYQNGLWV